MFAAIRETFAIERDDSLQLRDYPTLTHVVGFVRDRGTNLPAAAPAGVPSPPAAAAAAGGAGGGGPGGGRGAVGGVGEDRLPAGDAGSGPGSGGGPGRRHGEAGGGVRRDPGDVRDRAGRLAAAAGLPDADACGRVRPGPGDHPPGWWRRTPRRRRPRPPCRRSRCCPAAWRPPSRSRGGCPFRCSARPSTGAAPPGCGWTRPPASWSWPTRAAWATRWSASSASSASPCSQSPTRPTPRRWASGWPTSARTVRSRACTGCRPSTPRARSAELDLDAWHEALRIRVGLLYTTMRAVADGSPFLVAATRLGGQHGYDPAGAVNPLGGAVTGFAKAYAPGGRRRARQGGRPGAEPQDRGVGRAADRRDPA